MKSQKVKSLAGAFPLVMTFKRIMDPISRRDDDKEGYERLEWNFITNDHGADDLWRNSVSTCPKGMYCCVLPSLPYIFTV